MLNYFGSLGDLDKQFTVIAGTIEVINPNVGPFGAKNTLGVIAKTAFQ